MKNRNRILFGLLVLAMLIYGAFYFHNLSKKHKAFVDYTGFNYGIKFANESVYR